MIKYNFIKLLEDNNIEHDKNSAISRGFVVFDCPFCKNSARKNKGFYGGINIKKSYFKCWKCGIKPLEELFPLLVSKPWASLAKEYKYKFDLRDIYLEKNSERSQEKTAFFLPKEASLLGEREKKYLIKRGFEQPGTLIKKYALLSTKHLGLYKFRIIIPIFWQGRLVSFQGRDYSGQSSLRYKACPLNQEIIHHKHIVYGEPTNNHIVTVEGVVDKWKLGENSIATFGTGYTQAQINILAKYEKVSILYDPEEEAQKHAERLGKTLSGLNTKTETILLNSANDPGRLTIEEAAELMEKILSDF